MRILDTFFPIALGGNAIIPGGFGTGKTVTQQSLAKWADVDIIVYIGCGERGNEMTEVLTEFPRARGPAQRTRRSWTARCSSPTPRTCRWPRARRPSTSARTLAEYYRDMGYNVAMMADSTSRWGEALREVSGRLEEMPGEEGYPAYLATRLAALLRALRPRQAARRRRRAHRLRHDGRRGLAGRRRHVRADDAELPASHGRLLGARHRRSRTAATSRRSAGPRATRSTSARCRAGSRRTCADDWLEHRDRAMFDPPEGDRAPGDRAAGRPGRACPSPRRSSSRSRACCARTSCSSSRSTRSTRTARRRSSTWMLKTILAFNEAATAALNARRRRCARSSSCRIRDEIAMMKTTPHEEADRDDARSSTSEIADRDRRNRGALE